jgi:hypothetical protein
VLFLDESGFYLLPAVTRTDAPVGETPILHPTLSHDHLSMIGAVGLHEKLYFQVYETAISSAEVIRFLGHLRRLIPGKLLIVLDGVPIHRKGHPPVSQRWGRRADPPGALSQLCTGSGSRCATSVAVIFRRPGGSFAPRARDSIKSHTSSAAVCITAGLFRCSRADQ